MWRWGGVRGAVQKRTRESGKGSSGWVVCHTRVWVQQWREEGSEKFRVAGVDAEVVVCILPQRGSGLFAGMRAALSSAVCLIAKRSWVGYKRNTKKG